MSSVGLTCVYIDMFSPIQVSTYRDLQMGLIWQKKHDLEMIWQNNGEVMLSATTINNCQQRHVQVDGYYPPTNKV